MKIIFYVLTLLFAGTLSSLNAMTADALQARAAKLKSMKEGQLKDARAEGQRLYQQHKDDLDSGRIKAHRSDFEKLRDRYEGL